MNNGKRQVVAVHSADLQPNNNKNTKQVRAQDYIQRKFNRRSADMLLLELDSVRMHLEHQIRCHAFTCDVLYRRARNKARAPPA